MVNSVTGFRLSAISAPPPRFSGVEPNLTPVEEMLKSLFNKEIAQLFNADLLAQLYIETLSVEFYNLLQSGDGVNLIIEDALGKAKSDNVFRNNLIKMLRKYDFQLFDAPNANVYARQRAIEALLKI